MPDPVTLLTASAIANLAFPEFIKSGAGKVAKKLTAETIAKLNELRKIIVHKLRGKDPELDRALTDAEKGNVKAIATVSEHLESVMKDETFAQQMQSLAQQIQQDIDIQQGAGGEVWNVIGKAEKMYLRIIKHRLLKIAMVT